MKKLIISIAVAAVAATSIQAQGLVNAGNNNQTKISTNSVVNGSAAGVTAAASGAFYYALFYSTTQTSVGSSTAAFAGTNTSYVFNSSGWADAGILATNSGVTAGRFQSTSANASSVTALPNVGQVVAAQFVYIGWSANLGTLAQAEAFLLGTSNPLNQSLGWFGESAVSGAITTGNGGTQSTPLIFSTGAPQIGGFTLGEVSVSVVPEPGTLALAALGGASLLLFRRKQ